MIRIDGRLRRIENQTAYDSKATWPNDRSSIRPAIDHGSLSLETPSAPNTPKNNHSRGSKPTILNQLFTKVKFSCQISLNTVFLPWKYITRTNLGFWGKSSIKGPPTAAIAAMQSDNSKAG
jgi:hypothetical protein